jgi:hypothetical protein
VCLSLKDLNQQKVKICALDCDNNFKITENCSVLNIIKIGSRDVTL